MPRTPRIHVEGALCYVTSRAPEGAELFKNAKDYQTYLGFLKTYQEQFRFKLFAFVLLPDHLHLCLELTNGTTISAIMHALHSRYTKYINKRYGHSAHVFQERFKLTLVEKAPSLLSLTGYLHTHPKRSGMTQDVQGYPWSSCSSYLAAGASRPGPCLGGEVSEVLAALHEEHPGWTYALYLQSVPGATWDQWRQALEKPVAGSDRFVAFVEQKRKEAERQAPEIKEARNTAPAILPRMIPQPASARAHRSVGVTVAVAVVSAAVFAILLSARTIAFLKQTIRVLAQENQHTFSALASLTQPEGLSGTTWEVQMKPMLASVGMTAQTDRLRFEQDKMVSSQLDAEGFPACYYSWKPSRNGTVAWETIQIGPGGEMATWEGEWSGQAIHGTMTRRLPGGAVASFRFVGLNLGQGRTTRPTKET